MSRLFILGNGFDIAHGYKTRYVDFKAWLENELPFGTYTKHMPFIPVFQSKEYWGSNSITENDSRLMLIRFLLYLFERFDRIDMDYGWHNFEESLLYLDVEFFHDAQTEDIITEEDGIPPDFVEQLSRICADNIYCSLEAIPLLFSEWINTVTIKPCQIPFGSIITERDKGDDKSYFITFNYTETLEENYNISSAQILHIHGLRKRPEPLIVGYERGKKRDITLSTFGGSYDYARAKIEDAFKVLEKNTQHIISKNQDFYQRIHNAKIKEIFSFGFSFSKVDLPYIKEIVRMINGGKNTCWYLYCHKNSSALYYQSIIRQCGFNGKIIAMD